MTIWLILLLVGAVILYYTGFYASLYHKWNSLKLLWSLMRGVGNTSDSSGFVVFDNENSAMINYNRLGKGYMMFVPYNKKKMIDMAQLKVELHRENKSPLDITQQPGIPYLVSASMLGGKFITVINLDDGTTKYFYDNVIPMYGE